MEMLHKLIIVILCVAIAVEVLLGPGIMLLVGLGILIIIWVGRGGLLDGNPYKRMAYTPVPDHIEVGDIMKGQEIQDKTKVNSDSSMILYLLGFMLIAIDIGCMWARGIL